MSRRNLQGVLRTFLILSAAGLMLALAGPAAARPLTFADLQSLEGVRRGAPAPDGRHLLLQTSAPYRDSRHFDDDRLILLERARLFLVETQAARPKARAIAPGAGVIPLAYSPSGRLLAIGRLEQRHLALGILRLEDGNLSWPGLSVRAPRNGPSVVWRDERRLVALTALGQIDEATFAVGQPASARLQRMRDLQSRGEVTGALTFAAGRYAVPAPADTRVVEIELNRRSRRSLAQGAFDDLAISASRRVLALSGPALPPPLSKIPSVNLSDPRPGRHLVLLDLETGRLSDPCPSCDLAPAPLAWAPTKDRLLVFSRGIGDPGWTGGGYVAIDAPSGEAVRLEAPGFTAKAELLGGERFPFAPGGWQGDRPVIQLRASGAAPARLFAIEGTTLKPASLPTSDLLADDGVRGLLAHYRDAAYPRRPTSEEGVPIAQAGAATLVETRDQHGVMSLWLRRTGHTTTLLLRLNTHLSKVDLAVVRPLVRTRADGSSVTDWLYMPASRLGGPKPPLIVAPYPGIDYPEESEIQLPGAQPPAIVAALITARGYALLLPSLPRVEGSEPAAGFSKDVLDAVQLAAASGLIDAERVAVWGQSFGGYAALTLASQTSRFRAVVAQSSPVDLASLYGVFAAEARADPAAVQRRDGGIGWTEDGQAAMISPPWRDPERYRRNSPLSAVEQITAPVLLQVGDQDFFDQSQSEQMFTALRRQDKDVQLMVFPGEGHVLASPPNQIAFYNAVFAFLDGVLNPRAILGARSAPPNRTPRSRWPAD